MSEYESLPESPDTRTIALPIPHGTARALDVIEGRAPYSLELGDCIDGLRALPDKCVAHTFADPPYEAEAHSKGRRVGRGWSGKGSGSAEIVVKAIAYDAITNDEREAVADQIHRVTRGWSITFCQSEAAHLWRGAYTSGGARYIRTGIYWKDDAQPQFSGDRPGVGWEAIVICWHGEKRTSWNGGGKCARWRATRDGSAGSGNGSGTLVDGAKPLALMVDVLEDFTNPGDVICSPYGGAGTEILAALRLGRRGFGWEKKPEHLAIALERLRTGEARPVKGQVVMFASGGAT